MKVIKETDLLFDDISILDNTLEHNVLKVTSINANCDCDGYYSATNNDELLFDDVSILENVMRKNALRTTPINANCDCGG